MTKLEQTLINNGVQQFLDDNMESLLLTRCTDRIDYCQAWQGEMHDIVVLQSYQTKVAAYDINNNVFYDFLRWAYGYTATSAKHIAKFRHKYCDRDTIIMTYREV